MAKDGGRALTKKIEISKAQQVMLVAVGGASLAIGATIVVAINFIKYIGFNTKVITAKDESIAGYSKAIAASGACRKPTGKNGIYSSADLKKCEPNSVRAEEVADSLRGKILIDLAADENLESVARDVEDCNAGMTYSEMLEKYQDAVNRDEKEKMLNVIKTCSALRVIPDALPAGSNAESLLASLNQIFNISNWTPETLAPAGTGGEIEDSAFLSNIPVTLSIQTEGETTISILNNIEKSIREFNVVNAKIEWASENEIYLDAEAEAFYVEPETLVETTKTIRATTPKKKGAKK